MFQYTTIPSTAFQQNCTLVWCDESKEAAVIDPGDDLDCILQEVSRRDLRLGAMFDFPAAQPFTPTRWLRDDDTVQNGERSSEASRAFMGGILFAGSMGRIDFPQGDIETHLAASAKPTSM